VGFSICDVNCDVTLFLRTAAFFFGETVCRDSSASRFALRRIWE